jgi:hypothetical protein
MLWRHQVSNQRAGKWKAASMQGGDDMTMVNFFKYTKELLEERGEGDAAFYFEQVEDHLRTGKGLSSDKNTIAKILGL